MNSPHSGVFLVCLLGLAGCAGREPAPPAATPEPLIEHRRRGIELFHAGQYAESVAALGSWLERHEIARPDLAAAVRFHIALARAKMGQTAEAGAGFLEMCRRYADVPDAHPAARWRRWARRELDRLSDE